MKNIEKYQLSLDHTFKLKTLQRRNFFRKSVYLPVLIEKTGTTNEPIKTVLYDISGGGASIDNEKLGLKSHDDIKISFPNNNISLTAISFTS